MARTGPSSDSLKTPLVMLAFGAPNAHINEVPTDAKSLALASRGAAAMAEAEYRVNAWDYIQDFTFTFSPDSGWKATFRCFDPDFDNLLERVSVVQRNGTRVRVHFRFGWISDGGAVLMCSPRQGVVLWSEPEITPDGCYLTFEVQQHESYAKTVLKEERQWAAGQYRGDEIVKQALEGPFQEVNDLTRGIAPPTVLTPVPCELVTNNGQPITFKDMSPVSFVRDRLIRDNLLIPLNPNLRTVPMHLFEVSDDGRATYVLAPEGYQKEKVGIKRTFYVGRGRTSMVKSFKPKDLRQIANIFGGAGYTTGLTDSGVVSVEERSGINTTDAPTSENKDGTLFTRHSFDRDVETQRTRRDAAWAKACSFAFQAEAEIVGDPFIEVNDYLEFVVMRGGTLANAGGYIDSSDERSPEAVQRIDLLSGTFIVLGYEQKISGGEFATSLTLTRARIPVDTFSEDYTNDAIALSDSVKNRTQEQPETNMVTMRVDGTLPARRFGRNVLE